MLASFGSLVLSYVTTASGGAASLGLGGQHTPRGKGKGKDMGPVPAAAAAGNKVSPGSRPPSNHVPKGCTKPFPNNPHSDYINKPPFGDKSEGIL